MYKINNDITKKTIKQTLMISAIATLFLVSLGSMPALKSYALDLSSLMPSFGSHDSQDNNKGSIDTKDLLSCFGVSTDCTNINKNNNHRTTIDTKTPNPVGTGSCDNCFAQFLNPTQLGNLKFVLGVPVAGTDAQLCTAAKAQTESELRAAITAPVVGVTDAVATNIINCLKANGVILA